MELVIYNVPPVCTIVHDSFHIINNYFRFYHGIVHILNKKWVMWDNYNLAKNNNLEKFRRKIDLWNRRRPAFFNKNKCRYKSWSCIKIWISLFCKRGKSNGQKKKREKILNVLNKEKFVFSMVMWFVRFRIFGFVIRMGMRYICVISYFMGVHKNAFVNNKHSHNTNHSNDDGLHYYTMFNTHFHECPKIDKFKLSAMVRGKMLIYIYVFYQKVWVPCSWSFNYMIWLKGQYFLFIKVV